MGAVVVVVGAVGAAGAAGAGPADGAAADAAMAGEFIVDERSIVIAGGTTTANLPAAARKARRSVPSRDRVSCGSIVVVSIEQGCNADDRCRDLDRQRRNCREPPWFRHNFETFLGFMAAAMPLRF